MKGIAFTVRALLPVLLLLPLKAPASGRSSSKSPSGNYGIPRLAPGQVWISSVPVGLEVRSGENPRAKNVLGRTPIVLNGRDVGRSVTVSILKKEYGGELPDQISLIDFSSKTTHSIGEQSGTKVEDLGRAITYELHLPGKQTVIALFQSRDASLSEVARLYPPGSNFRFSDAVVGKRLAQKGVPPEYVRTGIRLLHRGGKVALPGGRGWLIAEVTPSGQVELLEPPAKPVK
jgi:hypothetical protein